MSSQNLCALDIHKFINFLLEYNVKTRNCINVHECEELIVLTSVLNIIY